MTVSGYAAFTTRGPLVVGAVADLSSLRASLPLPPPTFGLGAAAGARVLLPSPAEERAEGPDDGRVGA